MKKNILKRISLYLLSSFFIGCAYCQLNGVPVSKPFNPEKATAVASIRQETKNSLPAINEKVMRSFSRNFRTAQLPVWREDNSGYVARFDFEGRYVLAWFKKSGLLEMVVYNGSVNDLPIQEKQLIQSNFPDYAVTATHEIVYNAVHSWVVVVETCKSIKKVRILDDSLEVIESIKKSE